MAVFGGLVAKSCQTLCDPWTVAHQAPLSLGLPRQEYWSGLPFPSPGDLPNSGIEPTSPALAGRSFTAEPAGKPGQVYACLVYICICTPLKMLARLCALSAALKPRWSEPSPGCLGCHCLSIMSPLKSCPPHTWQTMPECMGAQRGGGRCSIWHPNWPNRLHFAFLAPLSTLFPTLWALQVSVFIKGTGTLFFWIFITAPHIHCFGSYHTESTL